MTYSLGGLIQASDYNGFRTSVNAIWGVGSGNSGYGQTNTLSSVAASSVVTAAQWSTLIARINSMRQHQSGVTSGLTSPVTGDVIAYLSTMNGQISTCNTNRLLSGGVGTTVAASSSASGAWNGTVQADRVCAFTWASANQMRYFFNTGGTVTWNAQASSFAGNTKSVNWDTIANTLGTQTISGSNFYSMTDQFVTYASLAGSGADYASNILYLQARVNAGTVPGTSTSLFLRALFVDSSSDTFNDTVSGTARLNATANQSVTTYLANTWGTVTAVNNNVVTQS